jgi:hypothetical protein
MQLFIEEAWDDLRPELHGEEITKYEMIDLAVKDDDQVHESLIAILTLEDQDLAFQDLKEAVWHWWTLHLQDHEDFFEDQIAAYIEECRQERRIDAMCEEAA